MGYKCLASFSTVDVDELDEPESWVISNFDVLMTSGPKIILVWSEVVHCWIIV
jgi:hypothetical protein